MKRKKYYFFTILILGGLATISPFSIDMYLPGFTAIAKDLNTTIDQVQLSLTSYVFGISIGQLFYGPLLDRFGRRKPLYAGLIIYVLASIGCAFTHSVESLILMRLLQAIGGCVGMVAAQALVRDLFPVNKSAQVFSLIILVIAVSPMIAPTIGGYVTAAFGWHWVFIILAGIALLIMAAVYFYLPLGKKADSTISLKPRSVLANYFVVSKQPQFLIYTLAGGIAMAGPFAYIVGSSDVYMNIYGLTEQQYGWAFALVAFGMIGTTQLNHLLLRHFKSESLIKVALFYQTIVGVTLVGGLLYTGYDIFGFTALVFLFVAGHGIMSPNVTALSMAPFTKHAGSASALLGSFRLGVGAVVSALVSLLHDGTSLPMAIIMLMCSLIGLIILNSGNAVVKYRARRVDAEREVSVLV
ncbi:MAG TPA: multidrug effflux MFS transporter [Cyclobacteriaceae bacterium]|nr:multidrug effflux MFS transporter [Cyclobacteriaceae bacterium]